MLRTVMAGGLPLTYELTIKKVKNCNLRVRPDGSVAVSVGRFVTPAQADAFVLSRADWIRRTAGRLEAERRRASAFSLLGEPFAARVLWDESARETAVLRGGVLWLSLHPDSGADGCIRLIRRFYAEAGAPVLEDSLRRMASLAAPFGVSAPQMKLRWMISRWGSCAAASGRVTISTALAAAPLACVDYVLLHELAHFRQPNHSPAFYAWLDRLMPDHRQRQALLRRYSARALDEAAAAPAAGAAAPVFRTRSG